MARQGGWKAWAVARDTQRKLYLIGDYQAHVHSEKIVLMVVRQEG
jgi:hypothetical protein